VFQALRRVGDNGDCAFLFLARWAGKAASNASDVEGSVVSLSETLLTTDKLIWRSFCLDGPERTPTGGEGTEGMGDDGGRALPGAGWREGELEVAVESITPLVGLTCRVAA
jgi:hypothetical protein